jgi:hypothetical protein
MLWLWKTIEFFLSRWLSSVPSCIILELTVQSLSYMYLKSFLLSNNMTLTFEPRPWKTIGFLLSWWLWSIQVIWPRSLWFDLYSAYNVFLLDNATTLTFDLRSWKTIGFFLSWWWCSMPSCMILENTVRSLSCLQGLERQTDGRTRLYHNTPRLKTGV